MVRSYTSRMPEKDVVYYFPLEFDKDVNGIVTRARPFNARYGPRIILVKSLFGTVGVEICENHQTETISYDFKGNVLAVRRACSRLSKLLGVELRRGAAENKSTPRVE